MNRLRETVEAGIGAVKSSRYNFHLPRARAMRMMGACTQLALLGYNLNKLGPRVRGAQELELAGNRFETEPLPVASAPNLFTRSTRSLPFEPGGGPRVPEFPDTQ